MTSEAPHAVRLVVRGRVQGVGFRWFVREAARAAGVAGRVRNNVDGSVEIVAQGSAAALGALRDAVRQGPAGARVDGVEECRLDDGERLPLPFMVDR